jgi:hypothetical protein
MGVTQKETEKFSAEVHRETLWTLAMAKVSAGQPLAAALLNAADEINALRAAGVVHRKVTQPFSAGRGVAIADEVRMEGLFDGGETVTARLVTVERTGPF